MSSLKGELLDVSVAPETPVEELRHRLLEVLQAPAAPRRMTYEEFLAWTDEDTLAEWVDGEVVMTSPAGDQHQDICGFLGAILRAFVETHQLGVVRVAPFQMRLARSGREPDVLFLAREHLQQLKKTYLDGPADLVVEILSPESAMRDRGQKFYEYEEAGIPEYWLIDPDRARVEFYQLDTQGRYAVVAPDEKRVYRSQALPDFWLDVDWLWQPPSLISTQQTLGLI